jgi:tetratricopeptide (TPR) repeat protein
MAGRVGGGPSSTRRGRVVRVLTALAVVVPLIFALIAGVATFAGRLDPNPGGWLAMLLAGIGVVQPAIRALSRWGQRQREQRESGATEAARLRHELDELVIFVGSVRDADPQYLGVAPSRAEERRYVRRSVDAELRERLASNDFVVVTGDSGAGKSRTAFEAALATFPEHTMVAPVTSGLVPTTLRRVIELIDGLGNADERPVLLWLDDLDRYLAAEALTTDLLASWGQRAVPVKVLATMQLAHWQEQRWPAQIVVPDVAFDLGQEPAVRVAESHGGRRDDAADRVASVLGRASRQDLTRLLTPGDDRTAATHLYGNHDWERVGLGEVLGAGPNLVELLNEAHGRHPRGVAAVEAAVAWRRVGVGRPIRRSELEALSARSPFLAEWTERREDFADGLRWACTPLPSSVIRLLAVRDRPGEGDGREAYFDPHDYVVEERERHGGDVGPETWEWIVDRESVTAEEVLLVGLAAHDRQLRQVAEKAYLRAAGALDPVTRARALNARGVVAWESGQADEAFRLWQEVDDRFRDSSEPAVRWRVATALRNRGLSFRLQERYAAAIVVYEELERRFTGADEPELRREVAWAMADRGLALTLLGRSQDAIVVYEEVERRFGDTTDPELLLEVAGSRAARADALGRTARPDEAIAVWEEVEQRFANAADPGQRTQVARAMVSRGALLGDLGRPEAAIAVWEEVEQRFVEATEAPLRWEVAMAMVTRATMLWQMARSEEAIAVWEDVRKRFVADTEPAMRTCVARAMVSRELTLRELGRMEEAAAATDELESFAGATESDLGPRVAKEMVDHGQFLGRSRRLEEAIAVYQGIELRFAGARRLELRTAVATAMLNRGLALRELERPKEAIAAFEGIEQGFATATEPDLRLAVAMAMVNRGSTLAQAERPEEAIAALEDVELRNDSRTPASPRCRAGWRMRWSSTG